MNPKDLKLQPSIASTIGLVSLVCLVIGNMIGSGVYVSSTYALGALGDARLVVLAWVIGGLHALCGAIAYAALAKRVRMSGGEYAFLSRFVHPAIGFMAGWISLVAGFAAPIATAALVFGEYLCETPEATIAARSVACIWIVICAAFHWINLKTGAWVNNAVVMIKFVGFGIFIVACFQFLLRSSASGGTASFAPALDQSLLATDYFAKLASPEVLTAMLVQLFFISLSYTGFNASIYIAGEIADGEPTETVEQPPSPIVPQSMILACGIVTLLYVLLNTLFLACDTRDSIVSNGDYFVSGVAMNVGGEFLQWVMRITIALSSATSVLAMMATGPRVTMQMAEDGWLPRWLGAGSRVPRGAIIVQALVSSAVVWIASVLELISYLGLTLTACGALATSTLWVAHREMSQRRAIAWWEHAALAVYIAGACGLLGAAWIVKPMQFWLCLATFASGIGIYWIAR